MLEREEGLEEQRVQERELQGGNLWTGPISGGCSR